METVSRHPLVSAAKGQLFSSYQMLETLVDVCPDEIWQGVFCEVPFWYQVYHTVYFVDYWLRADSAGVGFPSMPLDPRIPPEFEHGLPEDAFSTIAENQRLRLPMRAGSRSLNLSNAVAVVVFEAWRQAGFAGGN